MATQENVHGFTDQSSAQVNSAELVRSKWAMWSNFKHLVIGGGSAAIIALLALWWVTY